MCLRVSYLEQVVAENENLQLRQVLYVVRYLGELVRSQVQLNHVGPRPDVWSHNIHIQLGASQS